MTIPHDRIGGRRRLALTVMAAALSSHPVFASEVDPFAMLPVLDEATLAESRGGMTIHGIPVNVTIVVRSTLDGNQGLQTSLAIDDRGGIGRAETVALGGAAKQSEGGMTMNLGGGSVTHQVVDGQLRTVMSNTGDSRFLSQVTDINVDMPGFSTMTQTWQAHARAGGLGREAVLSALGR